MAVGHALVGQDGSPIKVPKGNPITIDGKLSDEEWKGAWRQEFNGGEIRLMQEGAHLLVGLKGLKDSWSHVYVSDGEDVYVLHASAALGAAIYRPSAGGLWQPIQTFKWEMRDPSQSSEASAARASYLSSHGWVANTGRMGNPGEFEFKLAGKFRQGGTMSLAVLLADNPKSPRFWPQTLADDCLKEELIFGQTPEGLKFKRESWAKIAW
jgi:hypothetical protein